MLTMTIEPEIEKRLEDLGAETDVKKTALLKQALLAALEDLEDVQMAERVLAEPGRRYTLEEVEQELGLAD